MSDPCVAISPNIVYCVGGIILLFLGFVFMKTRSGTFKLIALLAAFWAYFFLYVMFILPVHIPNPDTTQLYDNCTSIIWIGK